MGVHCMNPHASKIDERVHNIYIYTSTPFRLRLNNHKSTIKLKSPYSTIALHFNSSPHNLTHLKCILLEHAFQTTQNRKQAETGWIIKLQTHVKGLNADVGIVRYYKYFVDAAVVNNNNKNKDNRSVE